MQPRYSNTGKAKITGGNPLRGQLAVRGAKNSVPKNLVASLLTSQPTELHNVPRIRDVSIMIELISALGGSAVFDPVLGRVSVNPSSIRPIEVDVAKRFAGISRIPILLCGPLLHKFGKIFVPALGGCAIGERPIDYHLDALKKFGAKVDEVEGGVQISTASRLRGCQIRLPFPSVGATEQVILTAILAHGETELTNAAVEPEIMDLIAQLQKMGGRISLEADRTVRIEGVQDLSGCTHWSLPDRLEVASWACAAAASNGEIFVKGARHADLFAFLNVFARAGGAFAVEEGGIRFSRSRSGLRPVSFETGVHPGYMTDWQQPMVTLLTQANGISVVHETVYEGRFGYVEQLVSMGADITVRSDCLGSRCRFGRLNHGHSAIISGHRQLNGMEIVIPDLRAGFSYIIAALIAAGESTVLNMGLIERGYEGFSQKLTSLGAVCEFA